MQRKYLMMGMPDSGKTSFLAALFRKLEDGNESTLLRLDRTRNVKGLPKLMELADAQSQYKKLPRTEDGIETFVLPLLDKEDNEISFFVPDLSGELYKNVVKDRILDEKIIDLLEECDRILFFVNTQELIGEPRIRIGDIEDDSDKPQVRESKGKLFKAMLNPVYKVDLAELMQIMMSQFQMQKQVYVVISAWDVVEKENVGITPTAYLQKKIPLLYQIVSNNPQKIKCQVWGVSAQGIDFENEDEKNRLEEENREAIELVRAINKEGEVTNDLTVLLS